MAEEMRISYCSCEAI